MKQSFLGSVGLSVALALSLFFVTRCGSDGTTGIELKKLEVMSIEPACATPGATAYVEGKGFEGGNVTVTVGGIEADILTATGRYVSFLVPHAILSGPIVVVVMNASGKTATISWVRCDDGANVIFDVTFQ